MLRILTENKNLNAVLSLAGDCTAFPAIGVWRGIREQSLVLEFSGKTLAEVNRIADEIARLNNQEAVIVQEIPSMDEVRRQQCGTQVKAVELNYR